MAILEWEKPHGNYEILPIGKSKKEICELFGYEPHMYTSMTWSYPVESDKFGNTLTSLSLYFKDEIVTNIRLKIRE